MRKAQRVRGAGYSRATPGRPLPGVMDPVCPRCTCTDAHLPQPQPPPAALIARCHDSQVVSYEALATCLPACRC